MKLIQVLGTGCAKCAKLKEDVDAAVADLDLDAKVDKVEDIMKITEFGVMMTPALVVDGVVKVVGKIPSVDEIKSYLQ